ncbi:cation diffusion facilitator family transporter [Peptostreptococcus equinus]|uniref:Cation diffusion facilitator family transporter n=1 Tax=Peptostreptococcus equinus TaxID=3003601 RepID=A0ABY7JLY7_9FIRM|nr:cation diffusion facilitator family transporter [Peptostreptococcus sp. CBA3647]WAW14337.1 cation diffusion facilitator family transporter [Peptostreptococcus sp. CBA3647]
MKNKIELDTVTGDNREDIIIRTSIVGILANLLLVCVKLGVGIFSNSIAIILDAVNNASDMLSSIITIVGAKLANMKADKKHPLGHGRIEYFGAIIIAVIILYAGVASSIESIKKIINPIRPSYSNISLILIALAVFIKIFLGNYVKKAGEKINSNSLIASGMDAKLDAVVSAVTLFSAIFFISTGLSLEAYLGLLISFVIIKAGIDILKDTSSQLLGERVDYELVEKIRNTINQVDGIDGVYDLILSNYGPNRYLGSLHIEVPENMTIKESDVIQREISRRVMEEHGVIIAAIGIYPINVHDPEVEKIKEDIATIVKKHKSVINMHGFYLLREEKLIYFDVIIDYSIANREEDFDKLCEEVKTKYPLYKFEITMDIDAT